MNLRKQRKRLNTKSTEVQEILAERLNNLCKFLDEEYGINFGGCCYIAYCLARLLSKDKFEFSVIVYEDYELEDKFSEISEGHYHYAISIGNYIINSDGCDEDFCKNIYYNVRASEILNHYKNNSWNEQYASTKNKFIFKIIRAFYGDLTEDLREG